MKDMVPFWVLVRFRYSKRFDFGFGLVWLSLVLFDLVRFSVGYYSITGFGPRGSTRAVRASLYFH